MNFEHTNTALLQLEEQKILYITRGEARCELTFYHLEGNGSKGTDPFIFKHFNISNQVQLLPTCSQSH